MRSEDTALAGGDDSSFGTPPTDEELFAQARAHMEKYSGAASLSRELWDATVRLVERQYVSRESILEEAAALGETLISGQAGNSDYNAGLWDGIAKMQKAIRALKPPVLTEIRINSDCITDAG